MSGYKISPGREAGTKTNTFMGDRANDVAVAHAYGLRDDWRLSQRRGYGDGQKQPHLGIIWTAE